MKNISDMSREEAEARLSPEFSEAMRRYIDARERYGAESETAKDLLLHAMLIAPPAFMEDAKQMADEMGLTPEADYCLEDGTPMVSLDALAKHLGQSPEEADEAFQKYMAKRAELGLPQDGITTDPAKVFRRQ
jgi:ferredoxin-NADP reductase